MQISWIPHILPLRPLPMPIYQTLLPFFSLNFPTGRGAEGLGTRLRATGVRFLVARFWWHVFGGTFLVARFCSPPPELHETGTIRKHWNRATIYAETKRVPEQLSEIRALECGQKNCKNAKTPFATWWSASIGSKASSLLEETTILAILVSYAFERCVQPFWIAGKWFTVVSYKPSVGTRWLVVSNLEGSRLEWETRTEELKNKFILACKTHDLLRQKLI